MWPLCCSTLPSRPESNAFLTGLHTDADHIRFMRLALEEAKKCIATPTAFCVGAHSLLQSHLCSHADPVPLQAASSSPPLAPSSQQVTPASYPATLTPNNVPSTNFLLPLLSPERQSTPPWNLVPFDFQGTHLAFLECLRRRLVKCIWELRNRGILWNVKGREC